MKSLFRSLLKISIAGLSLLSLTSGHAAEKEQIDVLFLYSPAVSEHYDGAASTRINHIIESTNAIYESSNLDIQINAAEIQQYNIDDDISPYRLMANAKKSQDIAALRDKLGADLVVIYRLYKSGEPCGLGYRPPTLNSKWIGISYVAVNCAAYKTAHEIGHNMGLGHSYAQGSKAFLKYARGHGVDGKFSTIMAYSSAYHAPKVYKFSSPDYKCNNLTCGVKAGLAHEADAVKALRQTAPIVANLRKSSSPEQCDIQQAAIFSNVQSAYQDQKRKLDSLNLQLKTLQASKNSSQVNYQHVLNNYRKLVNEEYYPTLKRYQASKAAFIKQLADYRKGKISRETIIATYLTYRQTRGEVVSLYSKVSSFYTTKYRVAYNALITAKQTLSALQKSQQVEQTKFAQLETEYNEAKAIYQCA